jgi:hypothetical protein
MLEAFTTFDFINIAGKVMESSLITNLSSSGRNFYYIKINKKKKVK